MSKRYFKKELPESAVYIAGHPLKFDILETEDPTLAAQLDACISRGIGGVIALSAEQFAAESQKKTSGINYESAFKQNPQQRQSELSTLHALHAAGAGDKQRAQPNLVAKTNPGDSPVSGRAMPEPVSVPSPNAFSGIFAKPKTAKKSDVKAATAPAAT